MDKDKAIGLFRLRLNQVFIPFKEYGMDVYIPSAVEVIIKLALQFNEDLQVSPITKEESETPD